MIGSPAAAALVLLLGAASSSLAAPADTPPAPAAPVLRAVEVEGAKLFTRADVLRALRLSVGAPLRRTPEALAASLEDRYHLRGLPAARVLARFDADSGTLRFTVDEGRIAAVAFEGLGTGDDRHVREAIGLEPGTILRDAEVASGLRRLRDFSEGAFDTVGDPPYAIERTPEGARVTVRLRRRPAAFRWRFAPDFTAAPAYTRVDGLAPRVGGEVTLFDHTRFNHLGAYAQVAYGLSSDNARFALGARKSLFGRRALTVGYEFHDLTDSDDFFRGAGLERYPGWAKLSTSFQDYYRRRGHEAYAFVRPSPQLDLGVSYRADRYESLPVEADGSLFFEHTPRDNPAIDPGDMRSLVFTARWAQGPLYPDWTAERESFLVRSLEGDLFQREQGVRVDATLEVADADALGGDFTFQRFVGQVRGARRLAPRHTVFGRLLFGRSGGTPPLQRALPLGGLGTLRGRAFKQFYGEDLTLATAEYAFEPRAPWPALLAFYDGGEAGTNGDGSGWKSDLGFGVAWPAAGRRFGRVDVAFPLGREPGEKSVRVTGYLLLPF